MYITERRSVLKRFLTPDHYYDVLDSIQEDFFSRHSIKIIFCDIDNTLVRYSERTVTDYSERFIKRATKEGIKVVLVSNNTDNKRGQVFLTYDNVESISNAKKPVFSKAKIMKTLKKEGLKKENAIFIGDQIFTDVIAARFCGIRTLLVDPLGASLIPLFEIKRFFEKPIKKRYVNKYGKNL